MLILISGGSGSGKTTLAYKLKTPDTEIINFDDYQKEEKDVPMLEGMRNWDHPDAIDFDSLYNDIRQLLDGKEVKVMTKSLVLNPDYEKNGRIPIVLKPKKIIILEGYLSMHDKRIRELADVKIFLNIPIKISLARRDKVTYYNEDEYNKKVLIPMHKKYVEPQKKFADIVGPAPISEYKRLINSNNTIID